MTRLRVISGGVPSGEPPPIVWNRLPLDDQRRALVIRDAGAPGLCALAWDDGRPFLIGIRELRLPAQRVALDAWKTVAEVARLPIRDERSPLLRPFDEGSISTAQALELERRRREIRREMRPDLGELFDFTSRDRRDLFT